MRGHDNDAGVRRENPFLEQLRAPAIGEVHIHQREVEAEVGDELAGGADRAGPGHVRAESFQLGGELFAQQRLILDNQNPQTSQSVLGHIA